MKFLIQGGCLLRAFTLGVALLVLAACSGGSHSRGQFSGAVLGETQEAIVSKYGTPDQIDVTAPDKPRLVYSKKTFDPDNMNKVDDKTTVVLDKKDGKVVAVDILYN
jgi:uncharacterized cupredoxin-like copper-binding protein